ncbi:MAG: hypothetical protein JWO16_2092 [Sphingomonas bacterium]|nr:hypothetical protein [Sphingomonas bacterium]
MFENLPFRELRQLTGMSIEEVAAELGYSVKPYLSQALKADQEGSSKGSEKTLEPALADG